ncbi:MAG: hypothetical protein MJ082_05020, partial [Clostridia bacterium]|nr:hypothetical protein [Clostridia bacterium]
MTKRKTALLYVAVGGCFFFLAMLLSYVKFFSNSTFLVYFSQFLDLFAIVFLPSLCYCTCECANAGRRTGKLVFPALLCALPTLLYTVPAYYLDYYADGYGTDGSLLFAVIYAFFVFLLQALAGFLLLIYSSSAVKKRGPLFLGEPAFAFEKTSPRVFAVSTAVPAVLFLAIEIIDIITMIVDY